MSKRKSKPKRNAKPLTARKKVLQSNVHLQQTISEMVRDFDARRNETEKRISESNQQLWRNQQEQNEGLRIAEKHAMIQRRVFNDALAGCTRVTSIERKIQEGSDEVEEVQVIDWDWYAEQLINSADYNDFIVGVLVPEETVKQKTEQRSQRARAQVLHYCVSKALAKDEAKLREALEGDGLEGLLKDFMPNGVDWTDEMSLEMEDIAKAGLMLWEQKKQEAIKRAKKVRIHSAIDKLVRVMPDESIRKTADRIEAGEPILKDKDGNEIELSDEEAKEAAELMRSKINDPEAIEKAKNELMEETAAVAKIATEAQEAIAKGDAETAGRKMAELEEKVEEAEAKAPDDPNKQFPEGASIFGG